jgi:hypothetical protein
MSRLLPRRASRRLGVALAAPAAVLAVAASAASAASAAPAAAPQQATGGQPLPVAEQGYVQTLTGRAGVTRVPAGWTVLSWNLTLDAGASAALQLSCPAGTAIADLENGLPTSDVAALATLAPDDLVPLYGTRGGPLTATAPSAAPAPVGLTAVCLPRVTARTTVVRGRSPIAFPASPIALGLKRGAAIPRTWRLYQSVIRGAVSPDGAVGRIGRGCPGDLQDNQYAVSRPGAGGLSLPNDAFALAPSSQLGKGRGPVTVYTLCSSLVP